MILLRKFRGLTLAGGGYMRMSSISIAQYKKKATETQKHSQLKRIWLEEVTKKNFNAEIFASTCRNFSRFMRKNYHQQTFSLNKIFGGDYQYLNEIDLTDLRISQLIDLADFFNVATAICFVNTQNKNIKKFIDILLQLINEKIHESSANRNISYLSKTARCAETYQNKVYLSILQQLEQKIDQIQIYESISILNVVLRGKHSSKVTYTQINILKKILMKSNNSDWVAMAGTHRIIDFLNPILDFLKCTPFILEIEEIFKQMVVKIQQVLIRDYQYLTTQQLIRICKFLQQANPFSQNCLLIFKQLHKSVKEDGSAVIDPAFIIRFTCFVNLSAIQNAFPGWEQNILKLFSKYFTKKDISAKIIYQSLCQIIAIGFLSSQNKFKLTQYLKQNLVATQQQQIGLPGILKNIKLIQVHSRLHQWENFLQLIINIIDIHHKFETTRLFYPYAFMLINVDFIRDLGIKIDRQLIQSKLPAKKSIFKPKQQIQNSSNFNIVERLKYLLNQNLEIRNSGKLMRKINLRALQSIFKYLHINCKYNETCEVFSAIKLLEVQAGIILEQIAQVPIPRAYQKKMKNFIYSIFKFQEISIQMYFSAIRTIRNKNMRRSSLQAQFFISFIQKLPLQEKLQVYSDNTIIFFLLIFKKKYFLNEVLQIVESKKFSNDEYEYLLIRVLSFLVQNSNNIKDAIIFKEKILKYNLIDDKMLEYFCNILYFNGLSSKDQLQIYIKKLKTQSSQKYILKNLSSYEEALSNIYKTGKFGEGEQNLLKLYVVQVQQAYEKKEVAAWQLVRDLIRVVRHVNCNSQEFGNLQLKNIFAPALIAKVEKLNKQQFWAIEALALASEMKWKSNRLFDKVISVATLQQEWNSQYSAEDLQQLLIQYPIQNKWNQQFVTLLVNITMFCQDKIPHLYKLLKESDKLSLCKPNTRAYLQYLNKVLSHAEKKETNNKPIWKKI